MTLTKPTIVIIPGAFHLKECMSHLISSLYLAGYPVRTATLVSTGNASATTIDDIAMIRKDLLEPLFEEERNVVILAHSYAGIPTSVAVEGNSKQDRQAKGLLGGIIGLIYLSAFIPPVGGSLYDLIGGKWPQWQSPDNETGLVMIPDPVTPFYEDVDQFLHAILVGDIKGHSMKALQDPATSAGYRDTGYNGRRAYIRCTKDSAIPIFGQDAMVAQTGIDWDVITYETGHSPFLSQPKVLATTVSELATKWIMAA